jgi:hypothetical protein
VKNVDSKGKEHSAYSDDTHTPTYNEIKNIENGKAIRVQK